MTTATLNREDSKAADLRAFKLIEACENAVERAGGQIIYDDDLLDSHLYGCLIPNRGGRRTIIVSDRYPDLTTRAFILAHETAHFFDPALVRFGDQYPSEFDQNRGETVAHYASKILLIWFNMYNDVNLSWIQERIHEHTAKDEFFLESRSLFRRADAAANAILPPDGQKWLWNERRKEGRVPAEVPLGERVGKALGSLFGSLK